MANTLIQVKRSTVTATPTNGSLSAGEPAYSYSSNVMYIGTSDGTGVLPIGGQFYVNKTNSSYDIAIAAFGAANSAGSAEGLSNIYNQANTAYNQANAAYDKANSANVIASSAYDKANSANYFAYLVNANTVAAFDKANSSETIAIAGYNKANAANVLAYSSGLTASAAYDKANSANYFAYLVNANTVAAFDKANSAETIAIAAYGNSNTKFSSSGGTITGDVSIVGNLSFSGNTSFTNVSTYIVNDPLIYLAGNNYTSDIVDIGFIANYVNATGSNVHTGLYREHEDKQYYLFQGYDKEVIDNHIGALSNNMTLAVLNADIKTSNLVLGGQNTITWITSAYGQANSGVTIGSAAFDKANAGSLIAVSAYDKANSANYFAYLVNANTVAAFDKANTANVNAANASFLTTGIVSVGVGGTGATSFTSNGVIFGNGSGALNVTAAGTEGQVLQASSTGLPSFGMLDGGTF